MSVFTDLYKDNKIAIEKFSLNNRASNHRFFKKFIESLAINSFHWEGVPEMYRPQWIELLTYDHYLIGAFNHQGKLYILPASPIGVILPSGEYSDYIMFAPNGEVFTRSREDVELLYNNSLNLSTRSIIYELLENIDMSMDVIRAFLIRAKIGEHFDCDDESTANNITKAINDAIKCGNVFSASIGKSITDGVSKFSLFDTKTSNITVIWENIDKTLGLIQQNLGFVKSETVKRERLTEAESQDNREQARFGLISDMFLNRSSFCDRVNTHDGWNFNNLSCEMMRDYGDKENDEEVINNEND